MDKKSVNRQHTRSLECIRWRKKNQPAEQRKTIVAENHLHLHCFINSADALIQAQSTKTCQIFSPSDKAEFEWGHFHQESEDRKDRMKIAMFNPVAALFVFGEDFVQV